MGGTFALMRSLTDKGGAQPSKGQGPVPNIVIQAPPARQRPGPRPLRPKISDSFAVEGDPSDSGSRFWRHKHHPAGVCEQPPSPPQRLLREPESLRLPPHNLSQQLSHAPDQRPLSRPLIRVADRVQYLGESRV